ncbi:hypothetical protein ISCGN_023823 [Ixodes scapularis]
MSNIIVFAARWRVRIRGSPAAPSSGSGMPSEGLVVQETQLELVLLALLRLAEDVVELQSVGGQRRRDLHQALTASLPTLCPFFLATLDTHYTRYRDLKERASTEEEKTELALHRRLTERTLQTLSGFVDWMPLGQAMAGERLLPRIFCFLLGDEALRLCAAECLLQLLARKGKPGERQPLLALFSRETLDAVFSAARTLNRQKQRKDYIVYPSYHEPMSSIADKGH